MYALLLFLRISYQNILRIFLLTICLIAGALIYGALTSEAEEPPCYFLDTESLITSYTFDVMWDISNISDLLELLEEEKIRATFFISGAWLARYPEEAKAILGRGHEVGFTSYSGKPLWNLSEEELLAEFDALRSISHQTLEYTPVYFRPPRGEVNNMVVNAAAFYNFKTILWSIDYAVGGPGENSFDEFGNKMHPGAIIRFQTGTDNLLQLIPPLTAEIRGQGYRIMGLSDLLKRG